MAKQHRRNEEDTASDDSHEIEIDGVKFISYQMDPLMIYPIAPRVAKIVVPLLQHLGSLGIDTTDEASLQKSLETLLRAADGMGKIAPLLAGLAEGLAAKENASLPQELLKKTVAIVEDDEGNEKRTSLHEPKNINAVFKGRFFTMLRLMWFSVGVNLLNFSGGGSANSPSKE